MELKMLDVIAKVAACVCGKDGVISESEENTIFNLIIKNYPHYSIERFNKTLDDFFDETYQIEDYANKITSRDLKKFTLKLCEVSASSDGLDIQENIALHKVKILFGGDI